jgi:hypothetical protein
MPNNTTSWTYSRSLSDILETRTQFYLLKVQSVQRTKYSRKYQLHIIACRQVVKVKENVKFTLEQATKAQRYSCTLSITSALDGVGGQRHARPIYSPGKDPRRQVVAATTCDKFLMR